MRRERVTSPQFRREGAVRIIEETKKPVAQIARDLGVNGGTLGGWVTLARESRDGSSGLSKDGSAELQRLPGEVAELRMERDVLERSVVLWGRGDEVSVACFIADQRTMYEQDLSDMAAFGVARLWRCGGSGDAPVAPTQLMRETASMTAEYARTDRFRGARIHLCDLAGLKIRDCEVSGLRIIDCYGSDVYLGGDFEHLVVNDVDVTKYVEAELDREHPARVLARDAASPDDYGAAWDVIETLWTATLDRARLVPEATLHEQVDGEWSLVETQRHLLFAGDAWLGNAVLEEDGPYHPLGFPAGGMPADAAAKLGLTLEATPTLNEVLVPRLLRMATMRRVVEGLTEAELDRICGRKPAEPYPDQEYVVRRCLKVVLKEEAEHHRYAVRDLAVLEAGVRTD